MTKRVDMGVALFLGVACYILSSRRGLWSERLQGGWKRINDDGDCGVHP